MVGSAADEFNEVTAVAIGGRTKSTTEQRDYGTNYILASCKYIIELLSISSRREIS